METHSKNTGFGGLSRRRCLAIWNSAAWRASKGGKSENSTAWEAVTAGKSENSLAWEAPTGGKSENSLAWGAPTGGGKWKFLAWEASRGKSENSVAWEAPTGGKSENSLAWEASTRGKSENSRLGSLYGGEKWKLLSLGSSNWKHCRTWCFRLVLWRQKYKVPCFEGNHCKNMETHSKNTGFGGLSRRRCLAIWNSAAWRASKGGKSENSIAWEAVTAGKSENSLAWEAPTGGKSENSLAWGAPTGGESENS